MIDNSPLDGHQLIQNGNFKGKNDDSPMDGMGYVSRKI
jgi:hypothetical protein